MCLSELLRAILLSTFLLSARDVAVEGRVGVELRWFGHCLKGSPRVSLLLSGSALCGAALHWIVDSAMLSYLVHCCCI